MMALPGDALAIIFGSVRHIWACGAVCFGTYVDFMVNTAPSAVGPRVLGLRRWGPACHVSCVVSWCSPRRCQCFPLVHVQVNLRDRGACRLVCRSWRAAVDSLTVRVLELRSPVLVPALPRYQLLQQLTLSASLTSSSSDFSKALGLLPCLPHLAGLCLIFASPAAVKLPASLQALTRLTSLAVHAQPRQGPLQGLGQTGLSLVAGPTGPDGLGGDLEASAGGDGFGIAGGSGVATAEGGRALPPPRLPPVPQHLQQRPQPQHQGPVLSGAVAAAAAFAAAAASFGRQDSGGGGIGRSGVASAAAVRVAPPGLIALLLSLPYLSSVELLHVAVSATDVLSAIRHAAATASASATALGEARGAQRAPAGAPASSGVPGCCSGGLRRLVLVGSGINVMGVGAPAAALQLAQLEVGGLERVHLRFDFQFVFARQAQGHDGSRVGEGAALPPCVSRVPACRARALPTRAPLNQAASGNLAMKVMAEPARRIEHVWVWVRRRATRPTGRSVYPSIGTPSPGVLQKSRGATIVLASLTRAQVLTMDSCTGADELVPLLPLLTRLKVGH